MNNKQYLLLASLSSANIIHANPFGCCGRKSTQIKGAVTSVGNAQGSKICENGVSYDQLSSIALNTLKDMSCSPSVERGDSCASRFEEFLSQGSLAYTPTALSKKSIWFGSMMPDFTDASRVIVTHCGDDSEANDLLKILYLNNENKVVLSLTVKHASFCYTATQKIFRKTKSGEFLVVPLMGVVVVVSEDFRNQKIKEALENKDRIKQIAQLKSLKDYEKLLTQISMLELIYAEDAKINSFNDLLNTPLLGMTLYETEFATKDKSYSHRTQIMFGNMETLKTTDGKSSCIYGHIIKLSDFIVEKSPNDSKVIARNNHDIFWDHVNEARALAGPDNGSNVSDEHKQDMKSNGLNENGTSFMMEDKSNG